MEPHCSAGRGHTEQFLRKVKNVSNDLLASPELRAVAVLENRNYFSDEVINLRVHQRSFAALEGDANQQRIFSRGNILAAEEIEGFDGSNFRDVKRADGFGNLRKSDPFCKQKREIAFHCREARKRFVAPGGFRSFDRGIKSVEIELGEKDILAQFQ